MNEEECRCPIHVGHLCYDDRPPFSHNIRSKPEERTWGSPLSGHEFIYRIIHIRTGMCYVGRTERSLSDRWAGHRSARKLEARGNDPLYHAMNSDGLRMFVMEKLEECGNSIARERELDWMRHFHSWTPTDGYNRSSAEMVYARDLYLLLHPSHRPRYDHLRNELHALHHGLRDPVPQDRGLEEEFRETTEMFLREGRKLMEEISSLASPVIFKSA